MSKISIQWVRQRRRFEHGHAQIGALTKEVEKTGG